MTKRMFIVEEAAFLEGGNQRTEYLSDVPELYRDSFEEVDVSWGGEPYPGLLNTGTESVCLEKGYEATWGTASDLAVGPGEVLFRTFKGNPHVLGSYRRAKV